MFFKRITTPGHQAQEVFYKDVRDTYQRIRNRAKEINAQRAEEGGAGAGGVEQIQLHAVEPGTEIKITVPPADDGGDEDARRARRIFDGFPDEMKKALQTGSLDTVNEVLGKMKVEEAEELVGLFSEVRRTISDHHPTSPAYQRSVMRGTYANESLVTRPVS